MNNERYDDDERTNGNGLGSFSFFLLAIQLIAVIGVSVYLMIINILPAAYLMTAVGILALVWLLQFFFLQRSKNLVTAKRVFCVFLSILNIGVIGVVFWYLGGFVSAFNTISSLVGQKDVYSVRVLKSSGMDDISDIEGVTLGVNSMMDSSAKNKCMENLTGKLGSQPKTRSFDDIDTLASALLDGDSKAILFDEALLSTVEENLEGFTEKTVVLYEIEVETEKAKSDTKRENIDVTKDTFNIFITGMDSSGKIASKGNSDVNILATVDPKSKKVLLTTTPRDYWVPLEGDRNKYDKLTHAGNYGVECSTSTISHLYNTPVDFYVKVNFSSVEGLVDALGGITVDCDQAFTATTRSGQRVSFSKGKNNLNGAEALAYSRERKSLAGGDRARGKHQQQVIDAIIKKMTSPSMLTNYNKVLNVIEKNTVTDITTDQMTDLIKAQIKDSSSWTTESISVDGTGDNRYTYSYKKKKVYVMIPDESTVADAKSKISEYMN